MLEVELAVRSTQCRDAVLFASVPPGGDFPNVCGGDVTVSPFAFGHAHRVLQVFHGCVAQGLGRSVPEGLSGSGAFVVPPAGVVSWGGALALHHHSTSGVEGMVDGVQAGINVCCGCERGKGGTCS